MTAAADAITIASLRQMKAAGQKIVAVVAWDVHIARIADRIGAEIVSVGDSVGMNLWGQSNPTDITLDEMIIVGKAVRRGVKRALVSCDFPPGPLHGGVDEALAAARRFVADAGADLVKIDGAAERPDVVAALTRAGIAVFAQMQPSPGADLVAQAKQLEAVGAALIDFKHSGPEAGAAVATAVAIPVIGGLGGGPWLDGRLRMAHAAIGYAADNLDKPADTYANVAQITHDALRAYADDVRSGRQIKGQRS